MSDAIDPDLLARMNALVARGQLHLGGPGLSAGQPAAPRAAPDRARQAAAARAFRHRAGAEFHLCPPQPADPAARPQRDVCLRPRPRRARHPRQYLARRHLQRRLPERQRGTRKDCESCSASSPSPAASRAIARRRRRARSMRAASSATRCRTPTVRRSTTPISSSPAWWATARPRPGRWPRPGTPTNSSTRRPTARCCRSCTSTATRSPTPPSSPASAMRSCRSCSRATATRPISSRATSRRRCTS